MKIGSKSRYGVMALIDLVLSPTQPVCISVIAERQNLPMSYLEQIFNKLKQAGLVKSVRGMAGGYCLAKNESDIRLFDIMSALDLPFKAKRCEGKEIGCKADGTRCNSHDTWDAMDRLFDVYCKGITLAELKNNDSIGISNVS